LKPFVSRPIAIRRTNKFWELAKITNKRRRVESLIIIYKNPRRSIRKIAQRNAKTLSSAYSTYKVGHFVPEEIPEESWKKKETRKKQEKNNKKKQEKRETSKRGMREGR